MGSVSWTGYYPPLAMPRPVYGPLFQGARATRAAEQCWLSGRELKNLLEYDDTPMLGRIPLELQRALGKDEAQVFDLLDRIADNLSQRLQRVFTTYNRYLDGIYGKTPDELRAQYPTLAEYRYITASGAQLRLSLLGAGVYSLVYALRVNDRTYAFKVFASSETADEATSGQYKEAANGLYTTALPVCNLVRFHAGHPARNWHLLEYIDDAVDLSRRPGRTYQEHGFAFLDEKPANTRNGVRVDLGEMVREDTRQYSHDPRDVRSILSGVFLA